MTRPWDALSPDDRAQRVRDYLASNHAPCRACGYDLIGLSADICPECAAPVDRAQFAFLAPDRDDNYEARRLAEYLAANRASCPACAKPLQGVNGRECPNCGATLEVWQLIPRGLPGRRVSRMKWVVLAYGLYTLLAIAVALLALFLWR